MYKDNIKEEIEKNFGKTLTLDQLWTLVKLCKHVRLRCRNNTAFNNFFNILFKDHAIFHQIIKHHPDGRSYQGLKITMKTGETSEENEE